METFWKRCWVVDGEAVTLEAGGWIFPLSPRRLHVLHDAFGAIAGFCGISTSHNKEPIKFTPSRPPLDRLDISYPRVSEYMDACAVGMHIKNSKSYISSFFNPGTNKNDNPLKR